MYFLVRTFFPYLMILAGVLACGMGGPVLVLGNETAPTPVTLADVATAKARWLRVSGAGLDRAEAIVDQKVNAKTSAKKDIAYYVPLVDPTQDTLPPGRPFVLVRLRPDAFLRVPPVTAGRTEAIRVEDVVGLRSSPVTYPQRLKDYVRAEMKRPLEDVIVLDADGTPLQRGPAAVMISVGLALIAGGTLLARSRYRRRRAVFADASAPTA